MSEKTSEEQFKAKVKETIRQFVKHQGLSEVMALGLLIELGLED